jgi:hypothetical protein
VCCVVSLRCSMGKKTDKSLPAGCAGIIACQHSKHQLPVQSCHTCCSRSALSVAAWVLAN